MEVWAGRQLTLSRTFFCLFNNIQSCQTQADVDFDLVSKPFSRFYITNTSVEHICWITLVIDSYAWVHSNQDFRVIRVKGYQILVRFSYSYFRNRCDYEWLKMVFLFLSIYRMKMTLTDRHKMVRPLELDWLADLQHLYAIMPIFFPFFFLAPSQLLLILSSDYGHISL